MGQPQDLTLEGMIHDLNNVFQTMIEAAHLMAEDPEWTLVSGMILRSIERGREITSSLRAVNQPAAPLESVLENAVTLVQDLVRLQRRPEVEFACHVDPGIVLRRSWAWERVLINLFFNAVRAMPDGGRIQVRAERGERRVHLIVSDQGSGIPADLLPSIFDANVSTKKGGGLGLHIVQSIVREEQGEVTARNHEDGGAEIHISFPVVQMQAMAAAK